MEAQAAELEAKLAVIDRQIAQKEAERGEVEAAIAKIEAVLPSLRGQRDIRKQLMESEFGSKLLYLQAEQQVVEQERELVVQRNRREGVAQALAALERQRIQTSAEYRTSLLSDLAKAELQEAEHRQEAIKAAQRRELQTLTAPVDGVVQQISVHTVGGVVTPAQPLMVVVPAESRLEIEAMVTNQDIGFVRAGEPAEIKVDTFNFTRYGLLHGAVVSVSQDATVRERPPAGSSAGTDEAAARGANAGASATGQDLVYTAHVSLERTTIEIEDKLVSLVPGMAVTVEIKTGSRRVIEYLLSPLLRYRQEAMRER
jgi:hemolysin D